MKILKYSLLILFVFPLNCIESTSTGFRFDKVINIAGETIPVTDSVFFRYPFRIRKTDSLLYILDLHGTDYYCHTLTYPEMTLVTPLARKGNGPDEFLRVENIRLGRDKAVYLLDANNKAISIYHSFHDSLLQRIQLSEKLIRSLDFVLINDSLYVDSVGCTSSTLQLKIDEVTDPVCIDERDVLNTTNRFPSNQNYQCFLLDDENKVVIIGNPVHNRRTREIFLERVAQG